MTSALMKPEGPKIFLTRVNIFKNGYESGYVTDDEELTFPAFTRFVNKVYQIKFITVFFLQSVKLFTKKNVLFGDVGEKERKFGFVRW